AEQRVEDTAALEALLGPGLHISPTRFEKYQYCPFGYFLQYILKAAPRQKAELAPNISGTLTHWVLENALRRQGEAFKDLTPEELETLVNDLVDEYTEYIENAIGEGNVYRMSIRPHGAICVSERI
ncbi:PD-(D/E)XK nuclease family protein, partial [Clostridium sp.]|uniref:PD-(D/E)XK nuclease family protein n=1 Tax=Clostridium sp. TaxID=1506 RepID=UPI00257C88D9